MIRALAITLALLASAPVAASRAVDPLPAQRQLFLKAQAALSQGDRPLYLMKQLENYPLLPYLVHADLTRRLTTASEVEVSEFLEKYDGSPLANSLRVAWLKQLASQNRPQAFLRFDRPLNDTGLDCWRLRMRLAGGYPKSDVYNDVDKIWLSDTTLPDSCAPLIADWRRAGRLNEPLFWARLELAAKAGNTKLIIYLRSLMPVADRYLADLWRAALSSPTVLTSNKDFRGKSLRERDILVFALGRAARQDSLAALAHWQKVRARYRFTEDQEQRAIRGIALAMSGGSRPQAEAWLNLVKDAYADSDTREWRLRFALRAGDWPRVLRVIAAMPAEERDSDNNKYWQARAQIALGQPTGRPLMADLARKPNYQGFLANHVLGQKPILPLTPAPVAVSERKRIANQSGLTRARELFYLGRLGDARREWNASQDKLTPHEQLIATGIAFEWGWFDRPIFSLYKNPHPDAILLRFPLAFERPMLKESRKQAIDPAWAYAITRQESAFMPSVRSKAGAVGLMQVMPTTAEYIARKAGFDYSSSEELINPEVNIRFGTSYLRQMLDKHAGNPILATAAYNAGPGAVKRWLPETDALPADVWVESIPYKETRGYVKNVLAFNMIYATRLGQSERSMLMALNQFPVLSPSLTEAQAKR